MNQHAPPINLQYYSRPNGKLFLPPCLPHHAAKIIFPFAGGLRRFGTGHLIARSRLHLLSRLSWIRNAQTTTDHSCQIVLNLRVPWNRFYVARARIRPERVRSAFPFQNSSHACEDDGEETSDSFYRDHGSICIRGNSTKPIFAPVIKN